MPGGSLEGAGSGGVELAGTSRDEGDAGAEGELSGVDSGERIGAENSGGSAISTISERHAGADSGAGADTGADSGAGAHSLFLHILLLWAEEREMVSGLDSGAAGDPGLRTREGLR